MESFGAYLRALRKAKGMTNMELANLSGVSQAHLSQIENGLRTPSPQALRLISNALGVTHIGMMIKAGYVTEEEVLTFRQERGIKEH